MPRTALIVGVGLMGGSLAAGLCRAGWSVLLHHRRSEVAARAEARGFGRAITGFAQASSADIAVVCTPVGSIVDTARGLAAAVPSAITDVGSTKGSICADLAPLAQRFLGSHPMAGSHQQGLEHADAELYRGRVAIVTPTAATPPALLALIEELWSTVGSRVVRMDPASHDRAVAHASHVPHALACAAAAQLHAEAAAIAAGGFRDITRVAAASPELWADILAHNAPAVNAGLRSTIERLRALEHALAAGDRAAIEKWLAEGRAGRQRFDQANQR
jgi:prephenate dehydrogenase